MADDALLKNLAGMDVNDDAMSIASSNAENELELLHAQIRHQQGQLNVMSMTTTTLTQQANSTVMVITFSTQNCDQAGSQSTRPLPHMNLVLSA